jgi:hypothetical protein
LRGKIAILVTFNNEVPMGDSYRLGHRAIVGFEKKLPRGIRRIVLDVLKPHTPRLTDLAIMISRDEHVSGVNISVKEVDANTESITITLEGDDLQYDTVKEILQEAGAVVHSIDQVVAGKQLIEEVTLQPENS